MRKIVVNLPPNTAQPEKKTGEEPTPAQLSGIQNFVLPVLFSPLPLFACIGFAALDVSDIGLVGFVGGIECLGGLFYALFLTTLLKNAPKSRHTGTAFLYVLCWLFWMFFSVAAVLASFLSV